LEARLTDLRMKGIAIFGTFTSAAITISKVIPNDYIDFFFVLIKPGALIELISIFTIIVLAYQDNVYQRWLYGAFRNAIAIEDLLHKEINEKEYKKERLMLTYSISGHRSFSPEKKYWKAMIRSKLFWIGKFVYAAVLFGSILLLITLQGC
jgi:hypothetical protein